MDASEVSTTAVSELLILDAKLVLARWRSSQKYQWKKRKYVSTVFEITEKVSFNIASEASYVYIWSGQKLIKNAKNGPFCRVFENL